MKGAWLAIAAAALVLFAARRARGTSSSGDAGVDRLEGPGPDYPGATWLPAPDRSFVAHPGRRDVRWIVIHINDGGDSARATAQYFADGAAGNYTSTHYVVGRAGEIFQCVREVDIAQHAHAANAHSIGVENIGRTRGERGRGDPGLAITEANYRATAELCAVLCDDYGLPRDRTAIVGHSEIDPKTSHADCPQGAWDWDTFLGYLEELP